MTDPPNAELAELVVGRCLDVQPGWRVSVRATPLARPLVTEVARRIGRRGAYYLPRINWGPDRFRADLDWALEAPLASPANDLLRPAHKRTELAGRPHGVARDGRLA